MTQKERIIAQAMQMFVSQGIKSVRMDDIARQLGVSKRTLYEMFGDKESLLYLTMEYFFECKRLERREACAGARNVHEAMFRVLGCIMDDSEVIHRVLGNLRKFYPAVHERLLREAVRWTESGVLAAASGHLRIPPARMLVSDAVIESFFETEQDGAECATK